MFKAKLIDNQNYYKLRRKQISLTIFGILSVPLIYTYQLPIWVTGIGISLYVLAQILIYKNRKNLNSLIGNSKIEFDEKEIRVISKKINNKEIINLENIDKLIIKDNYSISPDRNITRSGKELIGKPTKNYIIIHQNNKERKLDFEIDSHYMIIQLNKVIEKWTNSTFSIEILNTELLKS